MWAVEDRQISRLEQGGSALLDVLMAFLLFIMLSTSVFVSIKDSAKRRFWVNEKVKELSVQKSELSLQKIDLILQGGSSLLELLIAMSLLALLIMLSIPSLQSAIRVERSLSGKTLSREDLEAQVAIERAVSSSFSLSGLITPWGVGCRDAEPRSVDVSQDRTGNILSAVELGEGFYRAKKEVSALGAVSFKFCWWGGIQEQPASPFDFVYGLGLGIEGGVTLTRSGGRWSSVQNCFSGTSIQAASIAPFWNTAGLIGFGDPNVRDEGDLLSQIRSVIPIKDAYTLSLEEDGVLRRTSILSRSRQPLAYKISSVRVSARAQSPNVCSLDVEVSAEGGREPIVRHYFYPIVSSSRLYDVFL